MLPSRTYHYVAVHPIVGWLMTVWLLTSFLISWTEGQCGGGTCGACERRLGCLTESWGRCCVQFFQHNGKRSGPGRDDDKMRSASSAEASLVSSPFAASFPDPFIRLVRKKLINIQTVGSLNYMQIINLVIN